MSQLKSIFVDRVFFCCISYVLVLAKYESKLCPPPVSILASREDKVNMHHILLIAGKKKGDLYLHSEYCKHSLDRIRVYVAQGIDDPAFLRSSRHQVLLFKPIEEIVRPGTSGCPPAS